jgi:riboflavin kinase/FMN adenylyltransferase
MDFLEVNNNLLKDNYAVALGNFDGVHLGHREVIITAMQKARELKCKSAVITFSPHPAKVLGQENFSEVLSLEDKISTIKHLGIDQVIVINFTEELSKMSGESFIDSICKKLTIKSITTGYNFKFGHKRQGDINTINSLRIKYNYKFNVVNQIFYNSCNISSSVLREVIKLGAMRLFSKFTSRLYYIKSQYIDSIESNHIYNIVDTKLLLPPDGIYLGKIDSYYGCIFLSKRQVIFKFIGDNIELPKHYTKIDFVMILGQEVSLDKVLNDKLKIDAYIKKSKFCLSLENS